MGQPLPPPAIIIPPESYEIAAQLGLEVHGRVILDAMVIARSRPGRAVVTPNDVLSAYNNSYGRQRGGETLFAIALGFIGLGGGALFTLYGLGDTQPNFVPAILAFVFLGVGVLLLGLSMGIKRAKR